MTMLKYANNFSEALTASKAGGTDYITVASGGGNFATVFGSSNDGSYAVPITIVNSSGGVVTNGYAISWDFGSEDTKVYVSSGITLATIGAGCTAHCRLRAEELMGGPSRNRLALGSITHHKLYAQYTYVSVGASGLETEMPDTSEFGEDGIPNRFVVVLEDSGATQPTLTWTPHMWGSIKYTAAGAPAFTSGYSRLLVTVDLCDSSTWLVSWDKFAD
jgi:hypothetical protein